MIRGPCAEGAERPCRRLEFSANGATRVTSQPVAGRGLLRGLPLLTLLLLTGGVVAAADRGPVRVVVWDEQQPRQAKAYENFLGNAIATHLKRLPGIRVRSMRLDDAQQGLSNEVLDFAQVLVWWGHVRQAEVSRETGRRIVKRIEAGRLSLIALHSAHWSTPFIEAMHARTKHDVVRRYEKDSAEVEFVYKRPKFYRAPPRSAQLTPHIRLQKFPEGRTVVNVLLPNCCFPAYRPDGAPSTLLTRLPKHPIARGLPARFSVAGTEMYDEPFHVPTPDEVVFEERWATGEWFRSGAVWKLGKGRVFYFRPGHETYPVYKQKLPLKVIENAVRWLASLQETSP